MQRRPRPRLVGPSTPPGTTAGWTPGSRPRAPRGPWATCSARTSRSTSRWPTTAPSATRTTARSSVADRPEPHLPVERHDRPERHRRRPGLRRRRRVRPEVADLRRDAAGRRGAPGRSTRTPTTTSATTRLAYFTSSPRAGRPARWPTHGMGTCPTADGVTPVDIAAAIRADVVAGTLPQVSWVVANQRNSEHPDATAGERARTSSTRCIQALDADPEVFNSDRAVPQLRRERRLLRPRAAAGRPGRHRRRVLLRHQHRPGLPGADDRHLAVDPRRLGRLAGLRPHLRAPVPGDLDRRPSARPRSATTSAPGAARSAATSPAPSTSPSRSAACPPSAATTNGPTLAECDPLSNPAPVTNAMPAQEPGTAPGPRAALPARRQPDPLHQRRRRQRARSGSRCSTRARRRPRPPTSRSTPTSTAAADRGSTRSAPSPGTDGSDFFNCGPGYGNGLYDLTVTGPNRFLRRFQGNATTAGRTPRSSPTTRLRRHRCGGDLVHHEQHRHQRPSPSPSPRTTTAPTARGRTTSPPARASPTTSTRSPSPTAGTTSRSPSAATPAGPAGSPATSRPARSASPADAAAGRRASGPQQAGAGPVRGRSANLRDPAPSRRRADRSGRPEPLNCSTRPGPHSRAVRASPAPVRAGAGCRVRNRSRNPSRRSCW